MISRGIDPDVAIRAGVRYDEKRNALLYPRIGLDHMPLGWKARELDSGRQYNFPSGIPLNQTEPFTTMDGSDMLIMCEGETDALRLASVWTGSEPRIVAVPGSSAFANEWAGHYAWADDVYLIPDADSAGERLVEKVCGLMPRTRVVRLGSGDLSEWLDSHLFAELLELMHDATTVSVKASLRRSSYSFRPSVDVSPGVLIELVNADTRLKRRGKEFIGLCPFHEEATPSFMVDPQKGLYYCHGCNAGGDAIKYLREKRGLSFREARGIAESIR